MPEGLRSGIVPENRGPAMSEQFQALPMDWQCATAAYPLVYLHDASITPVSPPIRNTKKNPSTHSIGVRTTILPFHIVVSQQKN